MSYYPVKETAKLFGLSVNAIYKMIYTKELESVKLGHRQLLTDIALHKLSKMKTINPIKLMLFKLKYKIVLSNSPLISYSQSSRQIKDRIAELKVQGYSNKQIARILNEEGYRKSNGKEFEEPDVYYRAKSRYVRAKVAKMNREFGLFNKSYLR